MFIKITGIRKRIIKRLNKELINSLGIIKIKLIKLN